MIERTDLSKVHLLAFYKTMTSVAAHLQAQDLDTMHMSEVADTVFLPALTHLDEALKQNRITGLTESLLELDARRDLMVVRLRQHLESFTDYPVEAVAQAAARLLLTLDKYGKSVQSLPNAEETAAIVNLLQDYEQKDAAADLKTTMGNAWVAELATVNEEYQSVGDERTRKEAQYEVGKSKVARNALQDAFKKLATKLASLANVYGEEPYMELAAQINTETANALLTVKQRRGRADAKKQQPPDAQA